MTLGSWLAALCTRFRAFEALASRFFLLFNPFNPRLPKIPLYAYMWEWTRSSGVDLKSREISELTGAATRYWLI